MNTSHSKSNWSSRAFPPSVVLTISTTLKALESGVDAEFATDFAAGFTAGGGTSLNAPAEVQVASRALVEVAAAASNCQGRNGSGFYWWGHQIRMDSCLTNVVVNAMWGGAGIATLVGLFTSPTGIGPAAAAVAVAAAVLGIGAAGIGICASWGKGIYVNQLYVGPPVCWSQ